MSELIQQVYGDVTITYWETDNRWRFELRGRERSAESLTKAKEAIDAPEPKEKKPFTKFNAYYNGYGDGFKFVEITSIAESTGYRGPEVWISSKAMGRKKVSSQDLIVDSPETLAAIAELERLTLEEKKLYDAKNVVRAAMKKVEIPA